MDDLPPLPQGYEPHELPADYTGPLFIESQIRAYAIAAIERNKAQAYERKRQRAKLVEQVQKERGCTAREARLWLAETNPEYGWKQR